MQIPIKKIKNKRNLNHEINNKYGLTQLFKIIKPRNVRLLNSD